MLPQYLKLRQVDLVSGICRSIHIVCWHGEVSAWGKPTGQTRATRSPNASHACIASSHMRRRRQRVDECPYLSVYPASASPCQFFKRLPWDNVNVRVRPNQSYVTLKKLSQHPRAPLIPRRPRSFTQGVFGRYGMCDQRPHSFNFYPRPYRAVGDFEGSLHRSAKAAEILSLGRRHALRLSEPGRDVCAVLVVSNCNAQR